MFWKVDGMLIEDLGYLILRKYIYYWDFLLFFCVFRDMVDVYYFIINGIFFFF